jgi:hypothetical protein
MLKVGHGLLYRNRLHLDRLTIELQLPLNRSQMTLSALQFQGLRNFASVLPFFSWEFRAV